MVPLNSILSYYYNLINMISLLDGLDLANSLMLIKTCHIFL
jgi:hypothetical protein